MPATDQQLRAIAFLAEACRPYGARHWDADGIYAKVAEVRDRSLGSIIIAAIQAAEDRNAMTPGVIPKPGPHWRTPESAPVTTADRVDPDKHCASCGESKPTCQARLANQRGMDPDDPRYDDHTYVAVGAARAMKRGDDVVEIVTAVREELTTMREPKHAEDRPTTRNPAADVVRAAIKEDA